MNYKRYGEKIKSIRTLNGITQAQLAEKSQISTNFLGQIERGERIPSLKTAVNIAKSLNASIDGLVYEDELSDNVIISELSMALSQISDKDKRLLTDIVRCFLNQNLNENS